MTLKGDNKMFFYLKILILQNFIKQGIPILPEETPKMYVF